MIDSKAISLTIQEIRMAHEIGRGERDGKVLTIRKVHETETDKEDVRFWYLGMTPEQRIVAVAE